MKNINLSTNLASHFFDLVIGKILTSRLRLSKHLAHNLCNLLLLGKISVFHNRRNASSRLLLLISKHLILCIYLVFRILACSRRLNASNLFLSLILHLGNLFLIVQLHFSKLFLILKSGVNHTSRGIISTSTLPSINLRKCSSKIITSILSFISGRLATKSNQIKQLIRNGRSASLQRTFKKSFTSFSHSTRNKTRDGLIRVRNIRALNGRFNTSITHAYSIVIGSKHITLNATGGGFLTASKQFRHGATSKSRSNTASNSTKHKSPHLSGWRQIISIITTIMATIQRINIIGSREGSRNRRRLKANQTGKKFRVGIKSNISTNRNNLISGVDRCIHLNAMKKTTITSINRQTIKI